MPRRTLLTLGLVVACVLAVCGSCSRETRSSGPTPGAAADGAKPVTVAFISNNSYEFWTYAQRGAEKAAKEFGVGLEFQMPAKGTPAEQRQIIEDLLSKGIKGIAISPNDAANQAAFLNGVAEMVPLITQDSDLPPGSKRLCYIGTNNYEAGKAAGRLVKAAMPDGGKVVIFVGKLDVQNAVERRQGVLDELAGAKGATGPTLGMYELVDTLTDDAKAERCKSNAEDMLAKLSADADRLCMVGLWAYNPPQILAAVRGAELQGRVRIVGFDEDVATLDGIAAGEIQGTIVQQPFEFGYQAVRLLKSLAAGDKSVLPEGGIQYVDHRVIERDSVAAFRAELEKLRQ
jgi:ribose transport system substrate-binding protein